MRSKLAVVAAMLAATVAITGPAAAQGPGTELDFLVFGLLARRLGTPYLIVMVIGGLVISLIPGMPGIVLNPDLVFLVVLPPLVYAAAWTTSWRDFRYNLVSISLRCWMRDTTEVSS